MNEPYLITVQGTWRDGGGEGFHAEFNTDFYGIDPQALGAASEAVFTPNIDDYKKRQDKKRNGFFFFKFSF